MDHPAGNPDVLDGQHCPLLPHVHVGLLKHDDDVSQCLLNRVFSVSLRSLVLEINIRVLLLQ